MYMKVLFIMIFDIFNLYLCIIFMLVFRQINNVDCGYYVLRFMKESMIIINLLFLIRYVNI